MIVLSSELDYYVIYSFYTKHMNSRVKVFRRLPLCVRDQTGSVHSIYEELQSFKIACRGLLEACCNYCLSEQYPHNLSVCSRQKFDLSMNIKFYYIVVYFCLMFITPHILDTLSYVCYNPCVESITRACKYYYQILSKVK